MKRNRLHKFFFAFSLIFFSTSCSNEYFFEKDADLISKFNSSRTALSDQIKICRTSAEGKTGKEIAGFNHFDNCSISPKIADKYGVKFISIELKRDPKSDAEFKKLLKDNFEPYQERTLIATNYAKEENLTIRIREKGYLYSPLPLKSSNVVTESLDPLATTEYNPNNQPRNKEVWRYRQIEPNWYIYFHYISQATL
jgi:hypothetical protein